MFADPQTITVNAVAKVLARIKTDGLSSIYQNADETYKLTLSHQVMNNGRIKTMARVDRRAIVTDPLTSETDYDTLSEWHVFERPAYGFTVTDLTDLTTGFKTWLDNTAVTKLFGKES